MLGNLAVLILLPLYGIPLMLLSYMKKKTNQESLHFSKKFNIPQLKIDTFKPIKDIYDFKQSMNIQPFKDIIFSHNSRQKKALIRYLANHPSKQSTKLLQLLAKDKEYDVRTYAITSMEKTRQKWITLLKKKKTKTQLQQLRYAYCLISFLQLNLCSPEMYRYYLDELSEKMQKIATLKRLSPIAKYRQFIIQLRYGELTHNADYIKTLYDTAQEKNTFHKALTLSYCQTAFEQNNFQQVRKCLSTLTLPISHPLHAHQTWWTK